jgi:hypothetical protein
MPMKITGTFLDEITYDIPSQNWGPEEWSTEFETMKRAGIDTVIIIRAGLRDKMIFESEVLRNHRAMLPAYVDLADLFLRLAEKHRMKLFWGTYDTGDWYQKPQEAVAVNKDFVGEVWDRYGKREAFAGWYLTFEITRDQPGHADLLLEASRQVKRISPDLPTLISPYIAGVKATPDGSSISLSEHRRDWDQIFGKVRECVDIVAFQDGHVEFLELADYLKLNVELAEKHGIECWSNVETFDRDMPIKFPPIDWRKLRYKMEAAETAGVSKLITFEFSHFLSPNSCYPAAHTLFRRYSEFAGLSW